MRIPRITRASSREPTLWEYLKPWAWGGWTAACFALGVIGEARWAWLGAGILWVIPVAWALNRAGQRYRGNRAARAALTAERRDPVSPIARWWRNRHIWFDELNVWERRFLERMEEAERYFQAVPLQGLKGWLHKREMRRRFADIRYYLGTSRNLRKDIRQEKLNKKMRDLRRTLDLEVEEAIAEDIASDDTIAQLRQVTAELNEAADSWWQDGSGETLRQ